MNMRIIIYIKLEKIKAMSIKYQVRIKFTNIETNKEKVWFEIILTI